MTLNPKMRREIFQIVWTTVRDYHYDPTLGGVNWLAARKKWEPRALAAPTDAGFYEALSGLLGELKQSHFAVIPPFDARSKAEGGASGGGVSGATLAWAENQVLVSQVRDGSPAAEAGIKPGFALLVRDGKPLAPVVQKFVAAKARPVEIGLFLRSLAGGGVGQSVAWAVRDETDRDRLVNVVCAPPKGEVVQQLGLPPVPVEFESKTLENNIGYLRFNIFLLPNLQKLRAAAEEMGGAKGIILDLRGNPGGLLPITYSIAGILSPKPGNLGTMRQRNGTLRFPFTPQEPRYAGPLAILTDELSLSCSEVLAGGLQELGRAKTVGRRTGGMVLPAQIKILPGGGRLEYAVADFKTPKGVLLEGRGVIPDIPVTLTRKLLLESSDPDVAAAQKWIAGKG